MKYVTRGNKSSSSFLGSFPVMQTNILFVVLYWYYPSDQIRLLEDLQSWNLSLPLVSAKKQWSVRVLSDEEEDNPTMGTCWINVAGGAVSFFWRFCGELAGFLPGLVLIPVCHCLVSYMRVMMMLQWGLVSYSSSVTLLVFLTAALHLLENIDGSEFMFLFTGKQGRTI